MQLIYDSGYSLYAIVRRNDGHVYNHTTASFENWDSAHLIAGMYDYSMDDEGGDLYTWTFPLTLSDDYQIVYYRLVGVNPADSDPIVEDKGALD